MMTATRTSDAGNAANAAADASANMDTQGGMASVRRVSCPIDVI